MPTITYKGERNGLGVIDVDGEEMFVARNEDENPDETCVQAAERWALAAYGVVLATPTSTPTLAETLAPDMLALTAAIEELRAALGATNPAAAAAAAKMKEHTGRMAAALGQP